MRFFHFLIALKVLAVGSDDSLVEPSYDARTTAAVALPPAQNFIEPGIMIRVDDEESDSSTFGFPDGYVNPSNISNFCHLFGRLVIPCVRIRYHSAIVFKSRSSSLCFVADG